MPLEAQTLGWGCVVPRSCKSHPSLFSRFTPSTYAISKMLLTEISPPPPLTFVLLQKNNWSARLPNEVNFGLFLFHIVVVFFYHLFVSRKKYHTCGIEWPQFQICDHPLLIHVVSTQILSTLQLYHHWATCFILDWYVRNVCPCVVFAFLK